MAKKPPTIDHAELNAQLIRIARRVVITPIQLIMGPNGGHYLRISEPAMLDLQNTLAVINEWFDEDGRPRH